MLLTSSDGAVAKLDGSVYRQVRLWSITRTDGWNRKFTDHNRTVPFMGNDFRPMNGIAASASRRETSFKGQNFESIGLISDSDITVDDLATDKFLNATIQEWVVDWMYPFHGYFLYSTFTIRDHDHDGMTWKAQVEGPVSKLETTIGETYTSGCRHIYGERGCNRSITSNNDPSNNFNTYDANGVFVAVQAANGVPQLVLNKYNQPLAPSPFKQRWMKIDTVHVATPPPGNDADNMHFFCDPADIPAAYAEPNPTLIYEQAVTMAVGNPGVITAPGHNLPADTPVSFTTTGALLTGLTPSTTYFVRNPGLNTLNVANTPGGSPINLSGTQSGVHTMTGGAVDYWDLQTKGGWFTKGRVQFNTGVLAGPTKYEIMEYDHPYGASYRIIYMRTSLPAVPAVNDEFTLYAGCEKTWDHCRGKNANPYFFGGFLFIPGPDKIYQRPGSA